jgi:MFS transporter, DHA1 family, multidrug resistance protein
LGPDEPERADNLARMALRTAPPEAAPVQGVASPWQGRPGRRLAALTLALLLGLQPVTTDLYLPALPALTQALGATMAQSQLTMSALLLAFGLAQLMWGPLADRFGRRPVLVAGLGLYCAASVGAALAGHIEWLIGWRVAQGAGMAAAVVCARALVRDLFQPHEGARVMSFGLTGLGVIALLSPLLGGLATAVGGWRAALAAVALIGAATLAWLLWRLPETAPALNPRATRPGPLLLQWSRIARHPVFVAWTLLVASAYGGLFVILAGSSYVYINTFGLSPRAYGGAMALGSLAYLAGTFLCRRWLRTAGMAGTVRRAAGFTLASALLMLAFVHAGWQSAWAVLIPQCLYCFAHGMHQPCAQAGAVGPFPHAAGTAAALAGCLLALVAFGIGLWLGANLDGTVKPLAHAFAAGGIATALVALTLVQRLPPQPARR